MYSPVWILLNPVTLAWPDICSTPQGLPLARALIHTDYEQKPLLTCQTSNFNSFCDFWNLITGSVFLQEKKKKWRNWAEINHDVEDWISHVLHTYQCALPRSCSRYSIKKVKLRGTWHNRWYLCEAMILCLGFYPRGRMGTKNSLGPDWPTTQSVDATYKYTILITDTKPNKWVSFAHLANSVSNNFKIFICSWRFFQQLFVYHIWLTH